MTLGKKNTDSFERRFGPPFADDLSGELDPIQRQGVLDPLAPVPSPDQIVRGLADQIDAARMASGKQILSRGVPSRKSVGNNRGAGRASAETVRQDQSLI